MNWGNIAKAVYFSGLSATIAIGVFKGITTTPDHRNYSVAERTFVRTIDGFAVGSMYGVAYVTFPIWAIPYAIEVSSK